MIDVKTVRLSQSISIHVTLAPKLSLSRPLPRLKGNTPKRQYVTNPRCFLHMAPSTRICGILLSF